MCVCERLWKEGIGMVGGTWGPGIIYGMFGISMVHRRWGLRWHREDGD